MDAQAELEALRKEREEKVKQIAEKRKQVEELRRRRTQRVAQQQAAANSAAAAGGPGKTSVGGAGAKKAAAASGGGDKAQSVDALVAEILGGGTFEAAALQKLVPTSAAGAGAGAGAAAGAAKVPASLKPPGREGRNLQAEHRMGVVSLEPQESEVYERSVQTELTGEYDGGGVGALVARVGKSMSKVPSANSNVLQQAQRISDKARQRAVKPEGGQDAHRRTVMPVNFEGWLQRDGEANAAELAKEEMSQEEKDRVMGQPEFKHFFSRATLLVERTLGSQDWDVTADWKSAENSSSGGEGLQDAMKYMDDYTEEKWAKGRPITDLEFSPHQNPMFLAAYGERANAALTDPDGCMLVWNLSMKSRPELCFSSPSSVLTAHFHRFDPSLFYGGTYAGGVVMWDARARATPVLRTPLSGKGHAHPVQALRQVGTQNATNLVTASNDGRVCVWSLAMLNVPQDTIDLKNETKNRGRELSVTSISFPENETNVLYVGAEDGSVCQVQLHGGSKVGVAEMYDGHDGPVAGLDMHPHQENASQHGVDTSIAVSCSFDWSVKLWMVKQYQSPVLSLDAFEDYVYDVKWHPTHPAVFASVDGEGHADLWNLNQNTESPIVRCENPNSQRRLALNRCHWSADGRRLAAGDSEGTISVYSVDRRVAEPRNEDFVQFTDRCRSFQPIMQRVRDSAYSGLSSSDSRYNLPRSGTSSATASTAARH